MKKRIFPIAILLLLSSLGFGQNEPNYTALANEAMTLYDGKEFLKAANTFTKAFAANGNKGTIGDRYDAACCWALANVADSAFYHLYKATEPGGWTNLAHITTDQDLNSLYTDPR